MFSYLHLAYTTRLMGLGYPLPYIFLAVLFLYLFTFTLAPAACPFGPAGYLLTSNKSAAPSSTPLIDPRLLFGILTGTFVLMQSTVPSMVYLSAHLLY